MRIIAGEWGGRRIAAPPGRDTRPTTDRVREAWMSTVAAEIPGALVLDLFAGSGALGLEALSRGARHATFVESAASALRALRANVDTLGADSRVRIVRGDAIRFLDMLEPGSYDLAFADPPYGTGLARAVAERFIARPFADLLSLEHGLADDIPADDAALQRRYGDTWITFLRAPA